MTTNKSRSVDWGGLDLTVRKLSVNAAHPGIAGTSVADGNFSVAGATGTGATCAGVLKLYTPETTVVALDQLGRVDFQAPSEASGTDSILVSASIWAEAVATFDASTNSTDLVVALGESEAAAEKFRITAKGGTRGAGPVVIPDATTYTVLAANSGRVHVFPDLTATCTATLPAAAAGLKYEFWYGGAAADAADWAIVTPALFKGGVNHQDSDGETTAPVYANGSSHLQLNVIKPEVGTTVTVISDGTNWYMNGIVCSITVPSMA